MANSMQIALDDHETRELRELAAKLQQTPESAAREVFVNGMYMLRRWAYLKQRSETVNVDEVIAMLRSKRNNNPPDPGDELPEDLQYLLAEGRS